MDRPDTPLACNGVAVHKDSTWLRQAKSRAITEGTGLAGIAEDSGVSTHTIRKWLKRHNLQFTKREVASYTTIWNKGVGGYKRSPHTAETIAKMRAAARRGPASNLWRGGADRSERLKITDWCSRHRKEFLIAAGYRCTNCESSERLELHHIKAVVDRPDLAYEPTNIQVLCKSCHAERHALNGDKKKWRERSRGNMLTVHWSKVRHVEFVGEQMTYDLEIEHASHNYVGNGIVVHNSQRYQDANKLGDMVERECRLQDTKNRQNSLETDHEPHHENWSLDQAEVWKAATRAYQYALQRGVAKEVARALLPEGLTPSRLYMNGTMRSWIFYLKQRLHPSTQKEHRLVADEALAVLRTVAPVTMSAFFPNESNQ
jgi:thymidylate synthase (FAD)